MKAVVWRLAVVAAALWVGVVASWPAAAQPVPPNQDKWGPYIDFEGRAGTQRNIGEGDLFAPLWQNPDTLVFGDLRTRFDDHNSAEGNAGVGIRHMLPAGWNLGAYGYFDRRHSPYGFLYNQVTMGAEALSIDWDVRANFYLPQGRLSHDVDSLTTAQISGTSVIVHDGQEKALTGFDGEIGWRVPVFAAIDTTQLRVFAGGYRFYADSVAPVQGPRGRAELVFDEVPHLWAGARLSVGAEVQNDAPRGTQAFAIVRLRVPLEIFGGERPKQLTPMERRMTDPIVRDVDIVSRAGTFTTETATQDANGHTLTLINSGTTSGANLPSAVTAAGNNSTVVLTGTFSTTASVTPNTGQTLTSGAVAVRTPSGRTATVTTSAAINATGGSLTSGSAVVVTNNNATVSNLTITTTASGGTGAIGLNVINATGVVISNNTISATTNGNNNAIGVQILSNAASSTTSVTLTNNNLSATATVAGNAANALVLNNLNGSGPTNFFNTINATVSGNTFNASGQSASNAVALVVPTSDTLTISTSSTGNVKPTGVCSNNTSGTTSGQIGFTDGSHCP